MTDSTTTTTSTTPPSSSSLPRIFVLISGNGSNLQSLIDATHTTPPTLPGTIIHVLSNKKHAYGLTRAATSSIPTTYHNLLPYKSKHPTSVPAARLAYDTDLSHIILSHRPDLVICAGWMHILSPAFLDPLSAAGIACINLHPALPGMFDGANAIERAYEAWRKGEIEKTGVMIHYVIKDVDRGEPILVKEVQFVEGESLDSLEERIHKVEHVAIVEGANLALEKIRREKAAQAAA